MHEIITLQLGHRANYLATHFWNTQESYFTYDDPAITSDVNHDVHFRAGVGTNGEETFTPRTIIYDLKGGFGGLRKWGGLYEQQQLSDGQDPAASQSIWEGSIVRHTDPQIAQSDYQRSLDEGDPRSPELSTQTVRYWSDFNRVFYHPRSIVQINDYELGSSLMPFEKWTSGEDLFVSMDRDADLLDRDVRLWAEECDQMQGFQIFTGADDAWGGFASRYVEMLRDDYGKLPIWTWGIEEDHSKGQRAQRSLRALNVARTITEVSSHGSMYIPLSVSATQLPDYVRLDSKSEWHTSALLSAAVETMTLPSRLRTNSHRQGLLGDLEAGLNTNSNQRIARLQCKILDPQSDLLQGNISGESKDSRVPSDSNHILSEEDGPHFNFPELDVDLSNSDIISPSSASKQGHISDHVFGAVETSRGIIKTDTANKSENENNYMKQSRRLAGLPVIESYQYSLQYPLLDSFPSIFSIRPGLSQVAVQSCLSTTSGVSSRIRNLRKLVTRMGTLEERENLANGLGEIGEAYDHGWQSGSEEDSDD